MAPPAKFPARPLPFRPAKTDYKIAPGSKLIPSSQNLPVRPAKVYPKTPVPSLTASPSVSSRPAKAYPGITPLKQKHLAEKRTSSKRIQEGLKSARKQVIKRLSMTSLKRKASNEHEGSPPGKRVLSEDASASHASLKLEETFGSNSSQSTTTKGRLSEESSHWKYLELLRMGWLHSDDTVSDHLGTVQHSVYGRFRDQVGHIKHRAKSLEAGSPGSCSSLTDCSSPASLGRPSLETVGECTVVVPCALPILAPFDWEEKEYILSTLPLKENVHL